MSTRVAIAAIQRLDRGRPRTDQDLVAVEAALRVRLGRSPGSDEIDLGILMRTPGDDDDLLTGLLYAEGVIRSASDVVSIDITRTDDVDLARVALGPDVDLAALTTSRALVTTSACGLCGRLEMLAADRRAAPPADAVPLSSRLLAALPGRLREGQVVFAETGGLHAAALFDTGGRLTALREDVGRHNAVDKTVGAACRASSLPAHDAILAVSGRVAYEIVQKAVMAGVQCVVAVGAPSSLAVDAARRTGITLVGFARHGGFNVYAGAHRLMQ